jgi:hypothetical protein
MCPDNFRSPAKGEPPMNETSYPDVESTSARGHEYVTGRAWLRTEARTPDRATEDEGLFGSVGSVVEGVWSSVSQCVRNHPIAFVCTLVGIGLALEFARERRFFQTR